MSIKSNKKNNQLIQKITNLNNLIQELKIESKEIDKIKTQSKNLTNDLNKPKQVRSAEHTGLGKPRDITPQLAKFLGCKPTDKKSRNDVTTAICEYIKEHKLQVPERRKFILFDKTLADLLLLEEGAEYSYTGIQSHFTHLFKDANAKDNMFEYVKVYASKNQLLKKQKIVLDKHLSELLNTDETELTIYKLDKICRNK